MTAKGTSSPGFIAFSVGKPNNQEQYITPNLSVRPEAFGDYSFTWKNDPITGAPWTADSLNILIVGLRHSAGQGSVQISEFKLVVTTMANQQEDQEPSQSAAATASPSSPLQSSAVNEQDSDTEEQEKPSTTSSSGSNSDSSTTSEESAGSDTEDNVIEDDDEDGDDSRNGDAQEKSGMSNDASASDDS